LCASRTARLYNDPAPTAIYTLSLHDALPICLVEDHAVGARQQFGDALVLEGEVGQEQRMVDHHHLGLHRGLARLDDEAVAIEGTDRKSTRLNSSHVKISYAVFCLKKKTNNKR